MNELIFSATAGGIVAALAILPYAIKEGRHIESLRAEVRDWKRSAHHWKTMYGVAQDETSEAREEIAAMKASVQPRDAKTGRMAKKVAL